MTLLITLLAAIAATILWYRDEHRAQMMTGTLSLIYWGASLMWLVDAAVGYHEEGMAFFTPSAKDILNDSCLGLAAVTLGLVIWLAILLVKDPKGVVRRTLMPRA